MEKDGTHSITPPSEDVVVVDHRPRITDPSTITIPTWRLICVCIGLCFGLFLSLVDTTIVATAIYTIGVDFDSLTTVTWIALAYTLSYLGCAVLFARMGDVAGRRNAFAAAYLIFLAFSLGCGFSQSLNGLIACRALQGLGGSGMYALTMVIGPEVALSLNKTKWIGGLIGAVVAISGILGPLLGGIITRYTTWRWIFWINAPIGFPPLILFLIGWPGPKHFGHPERRPLRELDVLGASMLILASVLVVFSFQEAGLNANPWRKVIFVAPLAVGCLCWVLLLGWEVFVDRSWEDSLATMLPIRLLRRRVYLAGVISTLLIGFPYFVVIYSLPLRLEVVNGQSPLAGGLALMPMVGSTAVASFFGGYLNSKKNRCFQTLLAGCGLMVIGTSLLSTLAHTVHVEPRTYAFQVFIGLGFGLTVSTASLMSTLECQIRDRAVAQGITAQARVLGGSIGIAASTAILGVLKRGQLTGIVTPGQLANLEDSMKTLTSVQIYAVQQAYSDAFREDMRVCAIISGIAVLVTFGVYQRSPMDIKDMRIFRMKEEMDRRKKMKAAKANSRGSAVEGSVDVDVARDVES